MGQTALRNVIVERMVNVTQNLDVFVSLDGWAGIAKTSVQRASLGISVRRDAPVITTPHAITFLDASVQMAGQEHSATSPAQKVYLAKIALGSVDAIMGHATLWWDVFVNTVGRGNTATSPVRVDGMDRVVRGSARAANIAVFVIT